MPKYTDEDIRNMSKITCKIAADYLGISPMAVSIGMRNDLLPIGFAIHNEERDFSIKRKRGSAELELYEYAFSLGKYKDVDKKYAGKELPGWRMKKE